MTAPLPVLLTVLFIGLKLTNHIDWSWVWVVSPILGTEVFMFSMALISVFLNWLTRKR